MKDLVNAALIVGGLSSISIGLWLIHPSAALIGLGGLALLLAYGTYRESKQQGKK